MCLLKQLAIVGFVTLPSISTSNAEPDKYVRWLMKERASLFDLGMFQLNIITLQHLRNYLEKLWPKATFMRVSAEYEWEKNRITIFVLGIKKTTSENECAFIVKSIKKLANIDPNTGKVLSASKISLFSEPFSHRGYKVLKKPKNIFKNVDKIIYIDIDLISTKERSGIKCHSPLLSKGYSVKRK